MNEPQRVLNLISGTRRIVIPVVNISYAVVDQAHVVVHLKTGESVSMELEWGSNGYKEWRELQRSISGTEV